MLILYFCCRNTCKHVVIVGKEKKKRKKSEKNSAGKLHMFLVFYLNHCWKHTLFKNDLLLCSPFKWSPHLACHIVFFPATCCFMSFFFKWKLNYPHTYMLINRIATPQRHLDVLAKSTDIAMIMEEAKLLLLLEYTRPPKWQVVFFYLLHYRRLKRQTGSAIIQ